MKGLKRFGAMAMAAALTVTLVVPVNVNAAVYSGSEVYDIDRTGTSTIDENDKVSHKITSETYKNRITGASWATTTEDEDAEWKAQNYFKEIKKATIGTDEYVTWHFEGNPGEKVESVKIKSGKDVITIKKCGSSEKDAYPTYDENTKQAFFRNYDGSRDVVGTYDSWADFYKAYKSLKRTRYAMEYRIFGKKPGTAKLQYKLGGKKHKITITVSDDARAIQSVTYAGKRLDETRDKDRKGNNGNILESQTNNKEGINYVTKKSGKISVKLGKDYKFVKAFYVKGTPYGTKNINIDNSDEYRIDKTTGSRIRRNPTTGIDLNGDGDTLDQIYGIEEKDFNANTVTFVKNNKKIKLDKIPDQEKTDITNTSGPVGGTQYTQVRKEESKDNMATTTLYVVYKSKVTKTYGIRSYNITYRTSKK
ncbi:hypothetical protein [Butyrivibrio sp. FC2001]|uniref:hypothetical protein n=1 Tax=Butyrivibrio sp. FC2001 TaxID=1280671 RepID=UPI0003F9E328|nr:hypothetical protein [Butyrivibrio sp. FC2001]